MTSTSLFAAPAAAALSAPAARPQRRIARSLPWTGPRADVTATAGTTGTPPDRRP
ncbi:hypothetical protein [Paracoccus nototheniae]|uniref:Uncharacterized protein n=1 Tax=Paracoccus nototheniae TaxID=2489002 RepID=A0ABW4DYT3_9RHOB|nr:hypothetical protein [Paracoccus nototheniae]